MLVPLAADGWRALLLQLQVTSAKFGRLRQVSATLIYI